MPKITYIAKDFQASSMTIIDQANAIIAQYAAQGFDLTVRQLFYQFVSRDLIPNTMRSYKRLASIINDARLAGLIDWDQITDRTRNERANSHWSTPGDIMRSAAASFAVDKWAEQEYRPVVFIEKDALVGVIEPICQSLDVPYLSCRGYTSQSEMWSAAMRLKKWKRWGQTPIIFHLGDHDPSGKDMTRDIQDRMNLFLGNDISLDRLALNWDQIEQYDPPSNPAKLSDSRSDAYVAEFGDSSWELDALEPAVIADLIEAAILNVRDDGAWERAVREENRGKRILDKAAERWEEVAEFLGVGDEENDE